MGNSYDKYHNIWGNSYDKYKDILTFQSLINFRDRSISFILEKAKNNFSDMAYQNLNVCHFNKYGFCKFKSTCRKPHIMEICSNNGCEIRVCSLRHPKSCRYFREIGYCKFGEWCLFKHGNGEGIKTNIALEKVDSKILKLEIESKILREYLAEKDAAIQN